MLASISLCLLLLLDPRPIACTCRDHFGNRAAAIWPAFGQEIDHRERKRYAPLPHNLVFCFAFHFET